MLIIILDRINVDLICENIGVCGK